MICLLLAYGGLKFIIMLDYGENIILEPTIEQYFENEYVFNSHTQGLEVAFSLTAYTEEEEYTSWDETYGRLLAKQMIWGERDSNGDALPTRFEELEIEPCKRSDFTFSDEA